MRKVCEAARNRDREQAQSERDEKQERNTRSRMAHVSQVRPGSSLARSLERVRKSRGELEVENEERTTAKDSSWEGGTAQISLAILRHSLVSRRGELEQTPTI